MADGSPGDPPGSPDCRSTVAATHVAAVQNVAAASGRAVRSGGRCAGGVCGADVRADADADVAGGGYVLG